MTDDPDAATVRRLAAILDLPVDDDVVAAALNRFRDLSALAGDPPPRSDSSAVSEGQVPDDEYNALLAVYDEPRTTRDEGPLAGTTVAVKDNVAVRGLRMTAGVPEFEYVPSFDATVVERLLNAGAGILGKANLDAFAFGPAGEWSEFGDPVNPVAPGHIPGGSSSGSGAAVAGGLTDAALGTDTGGSVRVPAACCGLVGVKPTHRLVPRFGFTGNAPSLDVIGPLAPDVGTAARMLDAMAGPDPRDPTTVPVDPGAVTGGVGADDLRVGLVESALDLVSNPLAAAVREAAERLAESEDAAVEPVALEFGDVDEAYAVIVAAEFAWYRRQRFAVRGEGFQYDRELRAALGDVPLTRHVAERVLPGALADEVTDGAAYVGAREVRDDFRERVDARLADLDALLLPTMRSLPPEFGTVSGGVGGNYSLTKPFSVYGGPAVSVPVGPVDGLPVGVQVVTPHFEDGVALRVARRLERAVA
jgi:aspartyl-tRNA(Asn)/glutamyl-tRNA(Gln) amidotransferase subunit A